ncbi:hypothetical protein [Flavobacterium sp. HJJ]|uniref:hypothetical protein n=1 Tax=Flavobacterium sp. HJJ TaxID=2783792 RepID=UPI00188A187D|nr:hypothetical protein [Flavobacterium sp. HJJ]MBF4471440.1 hypothetical protein [Flavobacterium sp. HJJ]
MIITIIIFIAAYFYFFNKSNKQDKSRIKAQGGISNKYGVLIQYILSYSPDMKILQMDERSILIRQKIANIGYVNYSVNNSFNRVYVRCTCTFNGEKPMDFNWEYAENYNQHLISAEIEGTIQGTLAGLKEVHISKVEAVRSQINELISSFSKSAIREYRGSSELRERVIEAIETGKSLAIEASHNLASNHDLNQKEVLLIIDMCCDKFYDSLN